VTAALVPSARWQYLPRLTSNRAMRRQNLANKRRQIDGDLCFGGIIGVVSIVGIVNAGRALS